MGDEYDGLDGLIQKVVEEACYAELRLYGWYPDGSGGVSYTAVGLGGGSTMKAAGPGHGHPSDLVSPNGGYIDQTDNGLDAPATLGQIYSYWETHIPPVFEPFKGLPKPDAFQELADHVRKTLMQLSTEGHKGSGTSSSGAASAQVDYDGNTTLALANQVAQTLNTWQGAAATSFATYMNLFQEVVGNQALACEVLRMTLLMEKEMWTRMRGDVVDFAKKSASAYSEAHGFTGGDLKAVLKVAGSVNTILGWFPAFKPATEVAGKGLTVAGLLVDTFGGKEPPPNDLGARHFKDILPKMQTHADKLEKTSQTVEGDIKKSLENLEKHVEESPPARSDGSQDQESFRLDRPNGTYSADSTSDFIYPGVVVNSKNVTDAAHILDGDIGPEMTTAAANLDDADSAYQWWRDSSSIGTGSWGCYSEYSAASYSLQKEIEETAKEMGWAAEMLRAVAADLDNTDNDVHDDFGGVRKKIDTYDHPTYPAPAYPGRNRPI
jgi:uncharacterized protein YukE